MAKKKEYKADLNQRYWLYQKLRFQNELSYFERPYAEDGRPPVFTRDEAWCNVILNPSGNQKEIDQLHALVPKGERHKWFGSMNSSQALAQSVLGNLAVHGLIDCLSALKCDEGTELFDKAHLSSDNFAMEHKINSLKEPRRTSLDGYFSGKYQIAIECKFTETEVGPCSRPRLRPTASNYESDHCDGNYSIQRERKERCPLSEVGILYWHYVPHLFKWDNNQDISPCPLDKNYQLVRNILAAGIKSNGKVSSSNGHVVLIYDKRNPSFQENGNGLTAYNETREALREPMMLRKCSWQRITHYLRDNSYLPWLTENLALKYGL